MPKFVVKPEGPFSFKQCLRVLGRSELEILHRTTPDSVSKMIFAPDLTLIRITSEDDATLQITTTGHLGTSKKEILTEYVHNWFDLAAPIPEFYQLAASDSILGPLTTNYAGLRVIKTLDLFEALSWAIIGQQVNLRFAYTIKRALVKTAGASQLFGGLEYYTFPQPDQVLHLSSSDLRKLQFSRQKIGYIREVAEIIGTEKITKKLLSQVSMEEARELLTSIRGVGNWTANYVLMRCLNFRDAFPIEDGGLHNALQKLLGRVQKPTLDEIQEMAQSWSGWRGYATFYLWRYLQDA